MTLKPREIRKLNHEQKLEKLKELRDELMHERGIAAMGGAPKSPGKIRSLRADIARLLTILNEEKEER